MKLQCEKCNRELIMDISKQRYEKIKYMLKCTCGGYYKEIIDNKGK